MKFPFSRNKNHSSKALTRPGGSFVASTKSHNHNNSSRKNRSSISRIERFFSHLLNTQLKKQIAFLLVLVLFGTVTIGISSSSASAKISKDNLISKYSLELEPIYISPADLGKSAEKVVVPTAVDPTKEDVLGTSASDGFYPLCTKKDATINYKNFITNEDLSANSGTEVTITAKTTFKLYKVTVPVIAWKGRPGCANSLCPPEKGPNGEIYAKFPELGKMFPAARILANPEAKQTTLKSLFETTGQDESWGANSGDSPAAVKASAFATLAGATKNSGIQSIVYKYTKGDPDKFVNPSAQNADPKNKSIAFSLAALTPPGSTAGTRPTSTDACVDVSNTDKYLVELNDPGFSKYVSNVTPASFLESITKKVSEWETCQSNPSSCSKKMIVGVEVSGPIGSNLSCGEKDCGDNLDYLMSMLYSPMSSYAKSVKDDSYPGALKDFYISTPCSILKDGYEEIKTRCLYNSSYILNHYRQWKLAMNPNQLNTTFPTEDEYLNALVEAWRKEGAL